MKILMKKILPFILIIIFVILIIAIPRQHAILHFIKEKRDLMDECVPVLAYHGFAPQSIKEDKFNDSKWIDSVENFERQMKYLYDNGWTTLTADEFYKWHSGNLDIPEKSCMITFDDGYYEMYYTIYPILKKYNFSAVSFIIGYYTPETTLPYDPAVRSNIGWDKIKEIKSSYPLFQFESHSYNLHGFDENGNEPWKTASTSELKEDFKLNERFHFKYMAYPYGGFNEKMLKVIESSEIKMAFTFKTSGYATKRCSPYKIPRQKITAETDFNEFKTILEKTL